MQYLVTKILARHRRFAFLTAVLFAIGIGSSSVAFALFDTIFLRPVPVREPNTLVRVIQHLPMVGLTRTFPYSCYRTLAGASTNLHSVTAATAGDLPFNVTAPLPVEAVGVSGVTANWFAELGITPVYGHVFMANYLENTSGMPPAVLSYPFWQRHFNRERGIADDQVIRIDEHAFSVVGVLPRDFNALSADATPDVFIPMPAYSSLSHLSLDELSFEINARLMPGKLRSQAEVECTALMHFPLKNYLQNVEKLSPEEVSVSLSRPIELENIGRGFSVFREHYGRYINFFIAFAGLLVILLCVNAAGLLTVQVAARQQDFALRLAIGATPLQLVKQLAMESLLLVVLGTFGGLLIAAALLPLAEHFFPPIRDSAGSLLPVFLEVRFSRRVLLFVAVAGGCVALLCSITSAVAVSRANVGKLLRLARASTTFRGRRIWITLQVALCTFILGAASLFVRSFEDLQEVDPGLDVSHIATFTGDLSKCSDPIRFTRTLTDRLLQLPGVIAVGISSKGVMRGKGLGATVTLINARTSAAQFLNASVNHVSLGYFDALGLRLRAGRAFLAPDEPSPNQEQPTKVIVNEAFARRFFQDGLKVGRDFTTNSAQRSGTRFEIVGVVSDSSYRSLREGIVPTFYTLRSHFASFVLNVRTRGNPASIINAIRKQWASVDASVPLLEAHTMSEEVDASAAGERLAAMLGLIFGIIAVLLVGAGLYGLLAYMVSQRYQELAIRIAIGARSTDIVWLIAKETITMLILGSVAGLITLLAAAPLLRSFLYGVSPLDPRSLGTGVLFIIVTGASATIVPAYRAIKTNPVEILRYEN